MSQSGLNVPWEAHEWINNSINTSVDEWVEIWVNKYSTTTMRGWPDSFMPAPSPLKELQYAWHLDGAERSKNNHQTGVFIKQTTLGHGPHPCLCPEFGPIRLPRQQFLSQFLHYEPWEGFISTLYVYMINNTSAAIECMKMYFTTLQLNSWYLKCKLFKYDVYCRISSLLLHLWSIWSQNYISNVISEKHNL